MDVKLVLLMEKVRYCKKEYVTGSSALSEDHAAYLLGAFSVLECKIARALWDTHMPIESILIEVVPSYKV